MRDAQADDQGQYRCQVATQPPMVLTVTLNVTGKTTPWQNGAREDSPKDLQQVALAAEGPHHNPLRAY